MVLHKKLIFLAFCASSALAGTDLSPTETALRALGVPPDSDPTATLESFLPALEERSGSWDWISREKSEMLRAEGFQPPFVLDLLERRVGMVLAGETRPQFWTAIGPEHPEADRPPLPTYPSNRPVRIALDPGHMGGAEWEALTGKFIRESTDAGARRLSEGVLALQVALLLEERLQRRGYEVFLTRRDHSPVSNLKPADLDLETWVKSSLRRRSSSTWFQGLLPRFLTEGVSAFTMDPDYQKLYSDKARLSYFFNGEDLRARAEKIAQFGPDLTVVIHFDISTPKATRDTPAPDPNGLNPEAKSSVKVYVPGGFFADEFATNEDRSWYLFHSLHRRRAHANLTLARQLVQSLTLGLGLPTDPSDMGNSVLLEAGVYARNLYLTRRHAVSPIAYVETLFYNTPAEFDALYPTPENQRGHVAGHSYTERLEDVVSAYEKGIVAWLTSLPQD